MSKDSLPIDLRLPKGTKIGKIYNKAMFLRVHVGSATSTDGTVYDMSTSTTGSPLIYSNKSKRFFALSWEDILSLALVMGIDK